MKKIELYSDGACRGNPGAGGYGTILRFVKDDGEIYEKEFSAGYANTTNNRMELMAVITGLEALNMPCDVTVTSDSKYVVDAFEQKWIESWIKNNFRKSDKKPVKNKDLWVRLLEAMKPHRVKFCWIKGHDGHPENERCDKLATTAADSDNLLVDEGFDESRDS